MKEITLEASIENIETVTDFISNELQKLGCSFKAEMQINVAIDELFGNIARYAYAPEVGNATVRFESEENPTCAIITFIDSGKPFNPLESAEPDTTLSADKRQEGGLGIFIVRKTMDDVSYRYSERQNILTIRKSLV